MQALVAVDGRAGAGLALQVDDASRRSGRCPAPTGPGPRRPSRCRRPTWARMPFTPVDAAVDGDDRHLGVDGLLQGGRHGVDVDRARSRCRRRPWSAPASTSAVCLGALFWPSASCGVAPCFFTSAFIAFSMWTKNGKFRPGTEVRIVRSLAEAEASGEIIVPARSAARSARLSSIFVSPCRLLSRPLTEAVLQCRGSAPAGQVARPHYGHGSRLGTSLGAPTGPLGLRVRPITSGTTPRPLDRRNEGGTLLDGAPTRRLRSRRGQTEFSGWRLCRLRSPDGLPRQPKDHSLNVHADVTPPDEQKRMHAVKRYEILDTPPDGAFDRVTAIAARRFNAPISIISIVDHDRIWFKSHHGVAVEQIGREPGFALPPSVAEPSHFDRCQCRPPLARQSSGRRGVRAAVLCRRAAADQRRAQPRHALRDRQQPRPIEQEQIDDLDGPGIRSDGPDGTAPVGPSRPGPGQLMAREIDHRVMNSLHFVSGLLTMQSRAPEMTRCRQPPEGGSQSGCGGCSGPSAFLLGRSCRGILHQVSAPAVRGTRRHPRKAGRGVRRRRTGPTTRIQPIGLTINELVTNAAKHGTGSIDVTIRLKGDVFELSVRNDGEALPPDFDPATSKGLGMKVVTALANQLGGRLAAGSDPTGGRVCFTLTFPV